MKQTHFKLSIIIFLVINASNIFAQFSNPNLDSHRNFKTINLGDTKLKWGKHLAPKGIYNGHETYSFLKDTCCDDIFDMSVEEIYLYFKSDSIVGIEIRTVKIQKGLSENDPTYMNVGLVRYNTFKSKFNSLFGAANAENMPNDGSNLIKQCQWAAANTYLELAYLYYGVMDGDRLIIQLWDKNYLSNKLKDEF
ncbi:MAG: hypothetical protein WAT43_19075 [Chitinophagales bacterium]